MTGQRNEYRERAQQERARKLCDAAERIFEVNMRDYVTLEALADTLREAPDAQFEPIFKAANVRPHRPKPPVQWCSDDVRRKVVERLRERAVLAATPIEELFAGLS